MGGGIVTSRRELARQRVAIREALLREDQHCMWCGKYFDDIMVYSSAESMPTIEHIIPKSHGGTDDMHNLGLACYDCNQRAMAAYHTPEYSAYLLAGGLT